LRMHPGAPRRPITRPSTARTSWPVTDPATCRARHSLVYSSTNVSHRSGLPRAVRSATKSYAQTSFLNRAGLLVQLLALLPRVGLLRALGAGCAGPLGAAGPLQARLTPQPADALEVHRPALVLQQGVDAPVAPARVLPRQPLDGPQQRQVSGAVARLPP